MTFVLWCIVKIFLVVADGLLFLLEAIPVPEWLQQAGINVAAIPPGVWYFLGPFQFGAGLSWLLSALLLRFMIRRLPVIG